MKNISKIFLLMFLIQFISSCEPKVEDFALDRRPFLGNQLRTDGYYYFEYTTDLGVTYRKIHFIYINGVISGGDVIDKRELEETEQKIRTGEWYELRKDKRSNWGIFQVDGQNIKFEKWYWGGGRNNACIRAGEILNDTTFVIQSSWCKNDGQNDARAKEEYFSFKEFSPKPDSSNAFID